MLDRGRDQMANKKKKGQMKQRRRLADMCMYKAQKETVSKTTNKKKIKKENNNG
jgi:hypothetical protein